MASNNLEQLTEFIKRAKAQGKTDNEIKALLVNSGWDESMVANAMTQDDLVPPPPPAPKSSGREIFFYLLQFFTLGTAAISLGSVVFAVINRYLLDEVSQRYYQDAGPITGALASLIVALPVFMTVSWKLIKEAAAGRTSVRSSIRRIITYLALFLASATVIGDVIALVYRFLSGQVDARFLFKVATILIIGGWIIWYYYITVKKDEHAQSYPKNWHQYHGIALLVVFVAALISGFMITGTPQERQKYVRDSERVSELQNIYYQVQAYYDREQKIPESLSAMAAGYVPNEPRDPLTHELYQYKPGEGLSYELCATFETDDKQLKQRDPYFVEPIGIVNWSHPAGYYCFQLQVTPRVKQ